MKCNTTLQQRYPNDKETISSYPGVLSCTPLKRKEARDEERAAEKAELKAKMCDDVELVARLGALEYQSKEEKKR